MAAREGHPASEWGGDGLHLPSLLSRRRLPSVLRPRLFDAAQEPDMHAHRDPHRALHHMLMYRTLPPGISNGESRFIFNFMRNIYYIQPTKPARRAERSRIYMSDF